MRYNNYMNNAQQASVQLDIAFAIEENETEQGAVETLLANASIAGRVTAERIVEFGPGGGWPVYEFVGDQANIDQLLAIYDGQ
jgi:hypothetical protein